MEEAEEVLPEVSYVEVERKFALSGDTETALQNLGAEFVGDKEIHDDYYDTDDFKLATADNWLRSRGGEWELKYSVSDQDRKSSPYDKYREVTNEMEIIQRLAVLLGLPCDSTKLDDLMQMAKFQSFARIVTHRKSFHIDNLHIVLDQTDFGYSVGEIEAIVLDESRIPDAINQIDSTAKALEMRPFYEQTFHFEQI